MTQDRILLKVKRDITKIESNARGIKSSVKRDNES